MARKLWIGINVAAKKTVPVTSVTPNIKTTPVSKTQQARTRNLVMGIASVTPVGRVAKNAATAANVVKDEAIMAKAGWNAAAKTNYRAQVKREATAKVSTAKQAIPSKIKTPTQSYDIKQTATGKIKATNTKTGITVTFPKGEKLNINKIKQAHAQKFINSK